ncbi:MAG: FAD-dependent oxidoreductase [Cyanobacteria bacterium]|nr:FAD-dependent oxidoreductase [Cyanobacteriota bacterium]
MTKTMILGGGMTGLAAGMASGLPVLEASDFSGGICSSYYMRPDDTHRLSHCPEDGEAYRFEIGGGHWIFGGDPAILRLIRTLTPVKTYQRRSSVYFCQDDRYVPYPLQNHLSYLPEYRSQALQEITRPKTGFVTLKDWQRQYFGDTLCDLFFDPFHQLYTAGLQGTIAPQDAYKSPVNLNHVIQGAFDAAPEVGYNTTFIYPEAGLNTLAQRLADRCDIRYDQQVIKIDWGDRTLHCANGSTYAYDQLIATLPLNHLMALTHIPVDAPANPYTSVLVLNIGAVRGPKCPDDHWLYNPDAQSGFHRVGFYSNVDVSFLPRSAQEKGDRVSIYVERAYLGGMKPTAAEITDYSTQVVQELQDWGYITTTDAVDPTWIEVAYTWMRPQSSWRQQALAALEAHQIYPIGRYGRWIFQGIADSIKDGLFVGSSFRF